MPSKEQYWKNPEKYRRMAKEYQKLKPESHIKAGRRYRKNHREQDREYCRKHQQRPEVKERRRQYQKEWRRKNKLANSAYHKVARYCKLADKCEFCENTEKLQAHHFAGYELWWIFVTVCQECHTWIEKAIPI